MGQPSAFGAGLGSGLSELSRQLMQVYAMKKEDERRKEDLARQEAWHQQDVGFRQGEIDYRTQRTGVEDQRYKVGQAVEAAKLAAPNTTLSPDLVGSPFENTFGQHRTEVAGAKPGAADQFGIPDFSQIGATPQTQQTFTRRWMPEDIEQSQVRTARDLQNEYTQLGMSHTQQQMTQAQVDAQTKAAAVARAMAAIPKLPKSAQPWAELDELPAWASLQNSYASHGAANQTRMDTVVDNFYKTRIAEGIQMAKAAFAANKPFIPETDPAQRAADEEAWVSQRLPGIYQDAKTETARRYPTHANFYGAGQQQQQKTPGPETNNIPLAEWNKKIAEGDGHAGVIKSQIDEIVMQAVDVKSKIQQLTELYNYLQSKQDANPIMPAGAAAVKDTIDKLMKGEAPVPSSGGVKLNLGNNEPHPNQAMIDAISKVFLANKGR